MVYELNKALYDQSKMLSLKQMVSKEYHEYLPLFLEAAVRTPPQRCTYNYNITLKEVFTTRFGQLYSLSKTELQTLGDWIQVNITK